MEVTRRKKDRGNSLGLGTGTRTCDGQRRKKNGDWVPVDFRDTEEKL
jgi:hypothetical protein